MYAERNYRLKNKDFYALRTVGVVSMTDEALKQMQDQLAWYDDELRRCPNNQFLGEARDELAKRISIEEARRQREEAQGRLF